MEQFEEYKGLWFSTNTPMQVKNVICHAYDHKLRVRLHLGNVHTGEVWPEEYDVIGRIGRSTGTEKIPLLIKNARSMGGGGILDHCILGIQEVTSKQWLYKANNMQMPSLTITMNPRTSLDPDRLQYVVEKENKNMAAFKTIKQAENYIAFMQGKRMKVS